jgi:hypothetical protein
MCIEQINGSERLFFLFKVYSKADNIEFSIKNLLASFNLKLFIGLKKLKVLVNPKKRKGPFFIESSEKKINKYLLEIFKFEKILFDSLNLRENLLKIFHYYWKIPKFLNIGNCIYQSKKSKKIFWKITTLFLDYVIISKLKENKNTLIGNKQLFNMEKEVWKNQTITRDQKKIRIDQLVSNFETIYNADDKENTELKKHRKNYKEKFESSLNSKKISLNNQKTDIYIEKKTEKKFILISKMKKNVLVLSLENEKLMIDYKKLKTKFFRINYDDIMSSKGFDKKGQILRPGNYCRILRGEHRYLDSRILFLSDGKFFGNILTNLKGNSNIFTTSSENVIFLEKLEHQKENFDANGKQFIKIKEGDYKGYVCKILSMDKNFLEVLVFSTSRIIKISKKNITPFFPEEDFELKCLY